MEEGGHRQRTRRELCPSASHRADAATGRADHQDPTSHPRPCRFLWRVCRGLSPRGRKEGLRTTQPAIGPPRVPAPGMHSPSCLSGPRGESKGQAGCLGVGMGPSGTVPKRHRGAGGINGRPHPVMFKEKGLLCKATWGKQPDLLHQEAKQCRKTLPLQSAADYAMQHEAVHPLRRQQKGN